MLLPSFLLLVFVRSAWPSGLTDLPVFRPGSCSHFIQHQQWQQAAACFEEGLPRPKQDVPGFYNDAAIVYHQLGDFDKAASYYQMAIEAAPHVPQYYVNLAITVAQRPGGKMSAAAPHFLRALELDPNNAGYPTTLAYFFYTQGNLNSARKYYKRALQLSPRDASVWNMLGACHARLGSPRLALRAYRWAAFYGTPSSLGHMACFWNFGTALLDSPNATHANLTEAVKWLTVVWESSPSPKADHSFALARAFTRLQQHANASRFYELGRRAALQGHPAPGFSMPPQLSAAQLNTIATANLTASIAEYAAKDHHYASIDPSTGRYSVSRPSFYFSDVAARDAIRASYTEAAERQPSDGTHLFNLGVLAFTERRYGEAAAFMERAVRKSPRNAEWRGSLANAYMEEKEYYKALEQLEVATQEKPDHGPHHYNKGQCLFHLKLYREASEALGIAVRLEPHHANLYLWWGSALIHAGYFEEGRQALTGGAAENQHQHSYHLYFDGQLHTVGRNAPFVANVSFAVL